MAENEILERMREITLNMPLYSDVSELYIGLREDAKLEAPKPYLPLKPIVYYGTSIAHGGCASRPGNCYTAALDRRLNVPVMNLGFSGAACMELPVAELLSEIDAEIYVLDSLPNMTPELVAERAIPFILKIVVCPTRGFSQRNRIFTSEITPS